jgi:hypothetical protein
MKDEMNDSTAENLEQGATRGTSRRDVLIGSASAVAAGSALGVMGFTSRAAAEEGASMAPDTSVRWSTDPGDLYNGRLGYGDGDVTGWNGRYIYGPTVGIVQLPANIPMLPGDMGNPTTFDFPVLYELLEGVDPFWVLSDKPHPVVLEKTIAACKKFTMQGVRTIIGNCGFFANYQPEVAKALDTGVQFFNGSLMQVPMLLTSVGSDKKVGVLTANAELLIPSPALKNSGVAAEDMDRVVIYGNEKGEQMNNITGETGRFSPKAFEKELVDLATRMVEEHPDVGAVVLECTEFPPHAFAIQDAIRRSVWDFTTMTNFMHAGAMRTPFTGWM